MTKNAVPIVSCLALILAGCIDRPARANSILLFTGTGSSPNDVAALRVILESDQLSYSTVSSRQLNAMSEAEIREYRLLIFPCGNFIEMGNSLNPRTATNIRRSIEQGVNYLGICAGAFLAGDSAPNGLNVTSGVRFRFYAAEERGIRKAAVAITGSDGQSLDQYWEDGPQLTGWGAVVSKYPDGTAATVEGRVGQGFVILTGIHPEAPEHWRKGLAFRTSVTADHEYAGAIVRAALNGAALPHF